MHPPQLAVCLCLVISLSACKQQSGDTQPKPNSDMPSRLLLVKVGGKWGFIDSSGKLKITPQFDSAEEFREERAVVCLGKCEFFPQDPPAGESKFGLIDEQGRYIANPQFDDAGSFSEGLANVCTGRCGYESSDGRWGFVDKTGNVVIPLQFGRAYPFSGGLAAICVGNCGKDGQGKWVSSTEAENS